MKINFGNMKKHQYSFSINEQVLCEYNKEYPITYKNKMAMLEKKLLEIFLTSENLLNFVDYINLYNNNPCYRNPNCIDCLIECKKCFPSPLYEDLSLAVGYDTPKCICPQKEKINNINNTNGKNKNGGLDCHEIFSEEDNELDSWGILFGNNDDY